MLFRKDREEAGGWDNGTLGQSRQGHCQQKTCSTSTYEEPKQLKSAILKHLRMLSPVIEGTNKEIVVETRTTKAAGGLGRPSKFGTKARKKCSRDELHQNQPEFTIN